VRNEEMTLQPNGTFRGHQVGAPRLRSEISAGELNGWDEIVAKQSASILDLDVTSTSDWARVLADVFLDGKMDCNVVLEDARGLAAVLPLFTRKVSVGTLPVRRLSPVTECYSCRCGLIIRDPGIEPLEALMNVLFRELGGWDVFTITLVGGSASERLFQELLLRRRWPHVRSSPLLSPFIDLRGNWNAYFSSLDRKFRSRLLRRERKLRDTGNCTFEVFEGVPGSGRFLEAMLEVENESWKQSAGTAVTAHDYQVRMYRSLIAVAAKRGWLSAYLLRLDNEPVGYQLGLLYNGIFSGLKHSYKEKFKDFSAGHLVQKLTIEALYERNTRFYDLMGTCDSHKMVWTQDTYSRSTYSLYNHTARGLFARYAGRVKRLLKRRP
jgi:Acetyltransferase (GNAT) domain